MPPTKKRRVSTYDEILSNNKRKKTFGGGDTFEVAKILSLRLDPENSDIALQFLVAWQNFGPNENSWENLDNLRLNTVFINYINEKFTQFEADILVNIANIKEEIKYKRRKILQNELKVVTMMERVFPFDPFEFKVHQVVFYLMTDPPKKYVTFIKNLVLRSHFFRLDQVQRVQQDKFAKDIAEREDISVIIENDVDFECPPNFNYVTKNVHSEELLISSDTTLLNQSNVELDNTIVNTENKFEGCKCRDGCSKDSNCCPKLLNLPFAYKETRNGSMKVVRLNRQEPIIECCANCLCGMHCLNRVTQQKRNLSLCLFKTEKVGWGVKTLQPIKKGIFLLEYTGELIGHAEAGKREMTAYLFDLNMDRLAHGYYTVDAYKYGNLARFVNHSCDPNSSIWIVSDCTKNPKNQ